MDRWINADMLIEEIDYLRQKEAEQNYINSAYYALGFVRMIVDNPPDKMILSEKTSRIKDTVDLNKNAKKVCNNCQKTLLDYYNFCPFCGAKTEEKEGEKNNW